MKIFDFQNSTTANYIREGKRGNTTETYIGDAYFFDKDITVCQYCNISMIGVHSSSNGSMAGENSWEVSKVWECPECGWWNSVFSRGEEGQDWELDEYKEIITRAIVKKYDLSDINIPLETLNRYLKKKPNVLFGVHFEKMEKLVGSVFKEHFSCEAIHCGKSHDGGVDLILLDGESQILVQVKRRMKPESVESVSAIREFVGTMVIKGADKGIFVTTANRFSKTAQSEVSDLLNNSKIIRRLDLVDFYKFVDIFNSTVRNVDSNKPWRKKIVFTEKQMNHYCRLVYLSERSPVYCKFITALCVNEIKKKRPNYNPVDEPIEDFLYHNQRDIIPELDVLFRNNHTLYRDFYSIW